jgi:hypothetical protein
LGDMIRAGNHSIIAAGGPGDSIGLETGKIAEN